MKTPKLLLIIAGSLAAIAAVLIAVSCIPPSGPEPEYVCAKNGQPSSGFKDTKKNCPITSESLKAHMAWEEGPLGRGKYIMRQIAVVSILGAIGCAVASPIVKSKQKKKSEK